MKRSHRTSKQPAKKRPPRHSKLSWLWLLLILIPNAFVILVIATVLEGQTGGVMLSVVPATGTYTVGDTISTDVKISTNGKTTSVVQGKLTMSSNISFTNASLTGSVFPEELVAASASSNVLQFTVGRFDSGYSATGGQVIHLNFLALSPGTATLVWDHQDSSALSLDADELLTFVSDASWTVQAVGGGTTGGSSGGGGSGGSSGGGGGGGGGGSDSGGGGGTSGGDGGATSSYSKAAGNQNIDLCAKAQQIASFTSPVPAELITSEIDGVAVTFFDVSSDAWYARFIQYLVESGIASGYKDAQGVLTGYFGPANNITFAEIAKMTLQSIKVDVDIVSQLPTNVSAQGQWFEKYVAAAEKEGWSLYEPSLDGNTYAPRAAVLKTILEGFHFPVQTDTARYSDVPVDYKYTREIATATLLGIVSGDDGKDTFRPEEPINRAEVAKMLSIAQALKCQ